MSHFATLVITETEPTKKDMQKLLLPWHEHECTGLDDFCVWVDKTEEYRSGYAEKTETVYRNPAGHEISRFTKEGNCNPVVHRRARPDEVEGGDSLFSRLKDGLQGSQTEIGAQGYGQYVFEIPEGFEAVEVPMSEIKSFEDWVGDYHGAKEIPDKPGCFGRFTNPNARWDWWAIGGRYSGRFQAKPGAAGSQGESRGVFQDEPLPEHQFDQIKLGDMDVEKMLAQRVSWFTEDYERAQADYKKANPDTEKTMEQALGEWGRVIRACRKSWDALPEETRPPFWTHIDNEGARPLSKSLGFGASSLWGDEDVPEEPSLEKYLEQVKSPLSALVVVKDGEWFEKGKMGWWGVCHDEKKDEDWNSQFADLIANLPETAWLSMVDCHI